MDWTSHDVVHKIRSVTGHQRVGHTGTLDPLATGLLLLCLGKATRIAQYLSNMDKTYLATFRLGVTTDTGDARGQVLERKSVDVTPDDIRAIIPFFLGDCEQTPPMFSAVKQNGKRLYQLARAGQTVERPSRTVHISRLDILGFEGSDLLLRTECSKGTYIRSLAVDMGARLGCGAHVHRLEREQIGTFHVRDALTVPEVEILQRKGSLAEALIGLNDALVHLPEIKIDQEQQQRIRHGSAVSLADSCMSHPDRDPREPVRLIGDGDRLLGLGTVEIHANRSAVSVRPFRVFI